jgi:hypothetical protein
MAADLSPSGLRKSRLRAELHLLAARYGTVSMDQQDGAWVLVQHFPLPPGWSRGRIAILIDIPHGNPGYPHVAPDYFWTWRDLRTDDNRSISHFFTQASSVDRTYHDRGWGHFSVHVLPGGWRAAGGSRLQDGSTLLSYLDLIACVFRDRKTLGGSAYGR